MSIYSTQEINRTTATNRILETYMILLSKNYKKLEEERYEPDFSIKDFINNFDKSLIDIENIQNYSNSMLADIMDEPYFRFSMFDNYFVFDFLDEK